MPSPFREWVVPVVLFAATLISTTFAGLFYVQEDVGFTGMVAIALTNPRLLAYGLPFSLTFIGILLAHEMGHYAACRRYGIRCTPPYFIPVPISIAGTLGAFIRIKSPFQSKKALFDVGVAGPLAGFAVVLPALVVGILNSTLIPKSSLPGMISFGEPLIFRWIGALVIGYAPERQDMLAHPVAMAAWFGLLATCLNLLPIWQLDGGHIAYAMFGRVRQRKISVAGALALVAVSFVGWPIPAYLLFGLLLLGFGFRFRFFHPPTLNDYEAIGRGRMALGIVAAVILIVSFTPVPISVT